MFINRRTSAIGFSLSQVDRPQWRIYNRDLFACVMVRCVFHWPRFAPGFSFCLSVRDRPIINEENAIAKINRRTIGHAFKQYLRLASSAFAYTIVWTCVFRCIKYTSNDTIFQTRLISILSEATVRSTDYQIADFRAFLKLQEHD